jgi:hypothetical protein
MQGRGQRSHGALHVTTRRAEAQGNHLGDIESPQEPLALLIAFGNDTEDIQSGRDKTGHHLAGQTRQGRTHHGDAGCATGGCPDEIDRVDAPARDGES